MRIVSVCLILLLLVFVVPSSALAHSRYNLTPPTEGQTTEALQKIVPIRFLPIHLLYFSILIKENVVRFFKPSALKKAEFDVVLAGKRLKEAYLLLDNSKIKESQKSLEKYSLRLEKMIAQMEKARSQNQDVAPFVDQTAEIFKSHETLIAAIYQKWQEKDDIYSYDESLQNAIKSYKKAIMAFENIKPGVKDRFMLTKDIELKTEAKPSPLPSESPVSQSSSSAKPKRIIY